MITWTVWISHFLIYVNHEPGRAYVHNLKQSVISIICETRELYKNRSFHHRLTPDKPVSTQSHTHQQHLFESFGVAGALAGALAGELEVTGVGGLAGTGVATKSRVCSFRIIACSFSWIVPILLVHTSKKSPYATNVDRRSDQENKLG
uniref:Uncharacterized protein n=1 Tax=Helianthus annuus TaxID=4232 RepID=A0A251U2E8_HELAN